MNFCPVCGKDTKETFCEEHKEVTLDYKEVVVRVCECKKYFYRNRWLPFQKLSDVVKKIAKDNIKQRVEINPLIDEKIEKKKIEIEITSQGEKIIIPGKIQIEQCPTCSKLGTPYFESTIQLRPKNDELLNFVNQQVSKDDTVFISIIEEVKEGFDLLLSSNKAAISIGRKLTKSFKGELKTSRHLWGYDKQRSKNLYRVTVCFRMNN